MANWNFEIEVLGWDVQTKNYPGAFSKRCEKVLLNTIKNSNKVLHLFSGTSKIGNVRIDLERLEATINEDVYKFIKSTFAQQNWEWVILDPPYKIENSQQDLKEYKDQTPVSASIPKRRALCDFFRKYCNNILWLNHCAPLPNGFYREKIWFFFPGGYRTIRILSWLKKEKELF